MTTAVYNKYPVASGAMVKGDNLATDVFKIALATAINTSDTTFTPGTSDLATGNGYTAGGNVATTVSSADTAGVTKLILSDPAIWNVTGAGFVFRYAILYNSTTGVPYGYWDYGSNQTMTNGEHVAITLDSVNGVLQVS